MTPGARAALLVVHGLGEHAGRYDAFAVRAARRGFSTFALDLRGHGRSEGTPTHVARFTDYTADVMALRATLLGALPDGLPLLLLGHSMGGLIGLRVLQEYPDAFPAAAITSPWLAESGSPPQWKDRLGRFLLRVTPRVAIPSGIRAGDLSHDPVVVRDYDIDPMVRKTITPGLYAAARGAQRAAIASPGRISARLLVLLAGEDRLIDTGTARAFAQAVGERGEVETFPGLFHEILNEADSGPVYRRLFDWVEDTLPPPEAA
jgi:alpha-beta hydrolase superfamily lysophospholipase